MTDSSPKPQRKRARKSDGSFKGDSPSSPGLNQAWEATDIEAALPKKQLPKYTPKEMISGMSTNTAGKYSGKEKVTRPGFGKITTTFY